MSGRGVGGTRGLEKAALTVGKKAKGTRDSGHGAGHAVSTVGEGAGGTQDSGHAASTVGEGAGGSQNSEHAASTVGEGAGGSRDSGHAASTVGQGAALTGQGPQVTELGATSFVDISFIQVQPSCKFALLILFSCAHKLLVEDLLRMYITLFPYQFAYNPVGFMSADFPSIPHAVDLLEAMKQSPTFQDGPPSDQLIAFIDQVENADSNSDVSEDDDNMSWGHYQFTAGGVTLTSVLTSWESTGGPKTACKLIAVAIQTCRVARHLCHMRGIRAGSYLSDAYLENVVDRLWTLWKKAGGVSFLFIIISSNTDTRTPCSQ
jgi:hypothetical protein